MKKSIKQLKEDISRIHEEKEKYFDDNRLKYIMSFLSQAQLYRDMVFKESGTEYDIRIERLADGEYKIDQRTTPFNIESISITTDINSIEYEIQFQILNDEMIAVRNKMDERIRIQQLRTNALAKLTQEEKNVLGI